jgi:hypothetical protein
MTEELTIDEQRELELAANTAEVSEAHDIYMTGATGTDVQDDLDDRVDMANATHTEVQNSDDGTTLNQTLNWQGVPVYTGGNVVNVADDAAVYPDDSTDVEDLEQEVQVRAALDGDSLFTTGGQIPPTDYVTSADLSPYVDGLFLAEASKQTGEKFF